MSESAPSSDLINWIILVQGVALVALALFVNFRKSRFNLPRWLANPLFYALALVFITASMGDTTFKALNTGAISWPGFLGCLLAFVGTGALFGRATEDFWRGRRQPKL